MPRVVTLLTDFGHRDGFAGTMKGVILTLAPHVAVVDIAHELPPQDIRAAALVLRGAAPYFPRGTVHVAVVDPGVGTERRAICIVTERALFVGPDNGVLTWAAPPTHRHAAFSVENPQYFLPVVSRTFHGRDVFAPVAAHLAAGLEPAFLGPRLEQITELPWPAVVENDDGSIQGEVIYEDRFGNLVTNLEASILGDFSSTEVWLTIGSSMIPGIVPTYGAVPAGQLAALLNSWGLLEIAVRNGSAARTLGVGVGAPVTVHLRGKGRSNGPTMANTTQA